MSAYFKSKTKYKSVPALLAALKDLGYSVVEVHAEPQPLIDWHGKKRPEKAEVIVRRQFIDGAANDVGFVKQPDGTYTAIISQYDRGSRWTPNAQKKLAQRYGFHVVAADARKRGYTVKEQAGKDGKIQVVLDRSY